jgi:iron(III) transport system ATP-binding protein
VYLGPEQRNLGMVFQSYAVWPHMSVFDNIAYPLKLRKKSKQDIAENVGRVLSMLNLETQADKKPSELSGGQQQRTALGRALVMEPDALLLDEPLSNLDAKLRDRMRFELKEIQRTLNLTIVYVPHDQDEAMAVSDRIVLMNQGRIQQVASPRVMFDTPENLFCAQFVGQSNMLTGRLEALDPRTGRATIALDGEHAPEVRVSLPDRDHSSTPSVREGEPVHAVVRYHNVRIAKKASSDTVTGTVIVGTYLGIYMQYEIDTLAGRIIVQTDSDTQLEEQQTVHLELTHVHLFPVG